MRFSLLDRIVGYEPGKSLQAVKVLALAEEYLQDHFPDRPVMPGVLMIETMVQAGAWLVRLTEDFARSVVVLREANNVKYGQFVRPGDKMEISVELKEMRDGRARIRGKGVVAGKTVVGGMLELECFNIADRDPSMAELDKRLVEHLRREYAMLNNISDSGRKVPEGS